MTFKTTKKSSILPTFFWSACVIASFIYATYPAWFSLIDAWSNYQAYSHGFLIIPLCLFLVFLKREELRNTSVKGSNLGLVLTILSLFLYLFAHVAEIVTIRSFSLILILVAVMLYLFGFQIIRKLIFPFSLFLFMVPIPSQIYSYLTLPLQLFVSKTSVWLASVLGVPVYSEGNIIHLPDKTLQVVKACSGMRSIVSLLTISAVLGYLTLHSNILRYVLFLSGLPTAIIVNIIRILLILIAIYYWGIDLTIDSFHIITGLVVFGSAILILILIRQCLLILEKHQITD